MADDNQNELAVWVIAQKFKKRAGVLSNDQIEILNQRLQAPMDITSEDLRDCYLAKQAYRRGELTKEEQAWWSEIPGWNWQEDTDEEFKAMVDACADFKAKHGRLPGQRQD